MLIKDQKRADKLKGVPLSLRNKFKAAFSRTSRKAASEAFCAECFGYSTAEALLCESVTCPLWEYRPGTKGPAKKK